MPYTIEKWEFTPPGNYKQMYPWDEWLNGKIWVIDVETDLKVKPKSFRAHAAGVCFKRDLSLRSNITELNGRKVVIFQAYPRAKSAPRPPGAKTPGRKRGLNFITMADRNEQIAKDFVDGMTYAKLCEKYDLTKSRIYQILVQQRSYERNQDPSDAIRETDLTNPDR